jgi:hypothetical protein
VKTVEPVEIMEHALVEAGGQLFESIDNARQTGYGFARFDEDVLVRYDWELTDLDSTETHDRWSVCEMPNQATPTNADEWRALVALFRERRARGDFA